MMICPRCNHITEAFEKLRDTIWIGNTGIRWWENQNL